MKRGNLIIAIFLVFVVVLSSVDVVSASNGGVIGFFEDLFIYLFSPIAPQLSVDIGGGGGGGGGTPICAYNCQTSCTGGEIEMSGACIAPQLCCRTFEVCDDGFLEGSEDCDNLNLGGETCFSQGYASGTLGCTGCSFNYDSCVALPTEVCDDGTCEGSEDCTSCPSDCGICKSLSDLVLYLPFDGNYLDYSGNGYHATCTGGGCPTLGLSYNGTVDGAYEFDGINDAFNITDNNDLDLSGDYSVLFWTNIYNLPPTWNIISKEHDVGVDKAGYVFDGYNSDLYFYPNNDSDAGDNFVTSVVNANQWMHLAVTYNKSASELNLYIDAVLENTNPAAVSAKPHINNLRIGSSTTPDRWFNGSIDELRIYNRALTLKEIEGIMAGTSLPGCVIDDDCDSLDQDYCSGTNLLHDEGICNASFECEVSTSTVEDCFMRSYFETVYNQCTVATGDIDQYSPNEWTCSAGACLDLGTPVILGNFQDCNDACGVVGDLVADADLCTNITETECPQANYPVMGCSGDNLVGYICSGTDAIQTIITDCNTLNGWQNVTGPENWVPYGDCTELKQIQQNYYDYFCNEGTTTECTYGAGANSTRWINTTETRDVVNGTACDDTFGCTENDQCTAGVCAGTTVDCTGDDLSEIATCFNTPDSINWTWDSRSAFTSVCQEPSGTCTTGDSTVTSSCVKGDCGAKCNDGETVVSRSCLDDSTVDISTSSCDSSTCGFQMISAEIDCLSNETCVAGICVNNNLTNFVWELNPGFNFVSLPLNTINLVGMDFNVTNATSEPQFIMFGYDSLDSKWLVGYSDLIETIGDFETSRGYIYYSPWNMSLVYEGELNDSYTVPLVADKWNLVGMPFNDSIDNIYGAGTYTVYQWDGFDYMDVSGATLGTGKSYWVYPGVPDLAPPSFSFWGWLTGLFS